MARLVLIGLPAVGKSTVGAEVARRLGANFVDSDQELERRFAMPVADIFAQEGEPAFRAAEAALVSELLMPEDDDVIALGGGAVLNPDVRANLSRQPWVVVLEAEETTVERRISQDTSRPLLRGGIDSWRRLRAERAGLYDAVGALRVRVDGREPSDIAEEILARARDSQPPVSGVSHIHVQGQPKGYDVVIGRGRSLSDAVRSSVRGARQVMIIHQPTVRERARALASILDPLKVTLQEVPDAEAGKTFDVAQECWTALGQRAFTRSDVIVGMGGGAVTDLAGWVAASWLRGIRLVQAPTSLLGMVDASVGGKTGVNTLEGKNLVGAFYAPSAVISDLDALDTLPQNELVPSLGEVVKYGLIGAPGILEILETSPASLKDVRSKELTRVIVECVRMKARVVGEDFRESGDREYLNYGHTLGHAIELAEGFRWRHGSAVAVGMMFAAELARRTGLLTDADVDLHRRLLVSVGLPTSYNGARWKDLLRTMHRDKKARGRVLRFVVLEGIGHPRILENPPEDVLEAAFAAIAE